MFKKNKNIEPICRNCRLFDSKNKFCEVVVLYEGEKTHLPVDEDDKCFFEQQFHAIDSSGKEEVFQAEVQQVRFWVEDEDGKPSKQGKVMIEYPPEFFGKDID